MTSSSTEFPAFLWVNSEPFDIGIVQHPLPTKLTHHVS